MGRVCNETQPHQGLNQFQEIHQNTVDDPPPPLPEEDLYEPPADYQPPTPTKKPPPPQPQVIHSFPPVQNEDHDMPPPQPFPPQQPVETHENHHQQTPQPFPQQNQYIQTPPQIPNFPQQHNNLHQQQAGIPVGMANSPFLPLQNQPWKTHLFDCMKNPQNALITFCFPCVTFGQIAEILDNGSTTCATSGMLYTCIALCTAMPCLMSCGYRSKLRAKFGLVESPASDCLIHCFCEYCALCQEYRELEERGFDPSVGHAGNMAKQQRQQQFGFTPPMQQRMI